ncbi:MAG: WbqC family protein, partial [Bacteroidales bacterium]|nr:WbqC family protein [Bacteroidales bacterium]
MLILSSAYLPPVEYLSAFLSADYISIEQHENFIKQTYRNRCVIPSANGLLSLSIPVTKNKKHNCPMNQIQIDYKQPWQRTHWRAIETAYNTSPFFLYYRDYFEGFYVQKHTDNLMEYNLQLFDLVLRLFKIKKQYVLTSEYVDVYGKEDMDLRQIIQPKTKT